MAILFDRRPTLASWPKRIYEWPELPEKFQPALAQWRSEGLPPGNVTYIPRINQYADSPEFATAWLGNTVLLQSAQRGALCQFRFRSQEVAFVDYYVQLLRCTVTITLGEERGAAQAVFSYNKTKEDQLMPVLNLTLGNPADRPSLFQHPDTPALQKLLQDSYAMYHTSTLCYRFGDKIQDFLWLMGKNRGLFNLNQPKPEYFIARMERGIVWIQKDFYGTRAIFIQHSRLRRIYVDSAGSRLWLCLVGESGPAARFSLLPNQQSAVTAFLASFPEAAGCHRPDTCP